ncbi:MAG: hypothetical protein ACLT9S_11160 [Faecalibacterium sp.]
MPYKAAQPAMSLTPESGEDGDRQLDIPVESPEEELADKIESGRGDRKRCRSRISS